MRTPALAAIPFSLALIGLTACGANGARNSADGHGSGLRQLVDDDFACDPNHERIDGLKDKYGANIQGGTEAQQHDAWNAISVLPEPYFKWVFEENEVPVSLTQASGSVRGATTLSNDGSGWRPSSIWVAPKLGNFHALPHELGHAVEPFVSASNPSFESDLDQLFSDIQQNGESNYMRGYALSSRTEFFAEIFDSYYCSKKSRKYMGDKMPATLEFAERHLIDPI